MQFVLAAISGILFTIGIRIWMKAMALKIRDNQK